MEGESIHRLVYTSSAAASNKPFLSSRPSTKDRIPYCSALIYFGASLASMADSSPMAVRTITLVSLLSSWNSFLILSPTSFSLLEQLWLANAYSMQVWMYLRQLDIVLGCSILWHEGKEAIIGDIELQCVSMNKGILLRMTYELILLAADIGNIHVVGRWAQLFHFLRGKDVDGNQMNFSVLFLSARRQ